MSLKEILDKEKNVRITLTFDLKVSDKIKKELLEDKERLAEFALKNCFRNNDKKLVDESIRAIRWEGEKEFLDELYNLTLIEQEGELTEEQKERYVKLVQLGRDNNIDIPFGIEM
jgi:hypothetical protein